MKLYKLTSENMSNVGGPMWNQSTSINWEKYFSSIPKAKKFAEKEFGDKISWTRSNNRITSGDLLYVMYDIEKVKIEE